MNHRQRVFSNGTLLVSELNELTDAGRYSCQAKSATSDSLAVNHVGLVIKGRLMSHDSSPPSNSSRLPLTFVRPNRNSVPPVVEPFSFAKSLHRGQRYNVMCTVVRGDLPVSIRWFKDGRPLEMEGASEGIAIKQLDPYSSTLTFASLQSNHRGLYACEAANEAGRANQSSWLVIHGESPILSLSLSAQLN